MTYGYKDYNNVESACRDETNEPIPAYTDKCASGKGSMSLVHIARSINRGRKIKQLRLYDCADVGTAAFCYRIVASSYPYPCNKTDRMKSLKPRNASSRLKLKLSESRGDAVTRYCVYTKHKASGQKPTSA